MTIKIYSLEQVDKIQHASQLASEVLDILTEYVQVGVTTEELDKIAYQHIVRKQKAVPACLGYRNYPKTICTSINHQVCHGIPQKRELKNGDIVNIDITVLKDGYFGDTSRMYCIGDQVPIRAKKLVEVAKECLKQAILACRPGAKFNAIGKVIETIAKHHQFSIVEDYCGHGIGDGFHQEPSVIHYYDPKFTINMEVGMVFTIEPMINIGKKTTKILQDGWTVVTRDRSLSAQWEHTIAITKQGNKILSQI